MRDRDRTDIRPIEFESGVHESLPVERLDFGELITRLGHAHFSSPQRPSFETLLLMRSTGGSFTVDFEAIDTRPRRIVRVRPGQVQVWNDVPSDTIVIAAAPAIARSPQWFPGDAAHADLDDLDWATAMQLVDAIGQHQRGFAGSSATSRLLVELFGALAALADLAQADAATSRLPEAYLAFRAAIEDDLSHHHDVSALANELGYSARTLSRACQQVTGQTAKQVLTERFVLEAKRRLAHSQASAARISDELGFSEPTNFTKFFVRNTGMSPTAFRQTLF